jgi:hypothetical protein
MTGMLMPTLRTCHSTVIEPNRVDLARWRDSDRVPATIARCVNTADGHEIDESAPAVDRSRMPNTGAVAVSRRPDNGDLRGAIGEASDGNPWWQFAPKPRLAWLRVDLHGR